MITCIFVTLPCYRSLSSPPKLYHQHISKSQTAFTSATRAMQLLTSSRLCKYVMFHHRLRDDIIIKLTGMTKECFTTAHAIMTNYPRQLEFMVKTSLFWAKVLDVRLYRYFNNESDITTILRKTPNKYNIVTPQSNTNNRYKTGAYRHYNRRIKTMCKRKEDARQQQGVMSLILQYKGFTSKTIKHLLASGPRQ